MNQILYPMPSMNASSSDSAWQSEDIISSSEIDSAQNLLLDRNDADVLQSNVFDRFGSK